MQYQVLGMVDSAELRHLVCLGMIDTEFLSCCYDLICCSSPGMYVLCHMAMGVCTSMQVLSATMLRGSLLATARSSFQYIVLFLTPSPQLPDTPLQTQIVSYYSGTVPGPQLPGYPSNPSPFDPPSPPLQFPSPLPHQDLLVGTGKASQCMPSASCVCCLLSHSVLVLQLTRCSPTSLTRTCQRTLGSTPLLAWT